MDELDLTIVHARDGVQWEHYLNQCFQRLIPHEGGERPLCIHSEALEQLSFPLSQAKISCVRRSKAQLVILTPDFLDFLQANPGALIGRLFEPSRVVAMLCGVEKQDIGPTHRAELVTFPNWHLMPVQDQDNDFVLNLFKKTVEVMEVAEESQRSVHKPRFKLIPRKVKEGSNKVFVMLHDPVTPDQDIKVHLTCSKGTMELNSKSRNAYNLQFIMPENLLKTSQMVTIHVVCDGVSLGVRQIKCESQMGELNQLLQNVNQPFAFLCQTLGVTQSMTEELDNALVKAFKKNVPAVGFRLLDLSKDGQGRKSEDEVPSLLHFAARYGLRELCSCLLDCPGADSACHLRNAQGRTPAEEAENNGNSSIAHMLENFVNLAVTADLYSFVSMMKELRDPCKLDDTVHHHEYSKAADQLYDCPCPNPRPIEIATEPEEDDTDSTYLPMSVSGSSVCGFDARKSPVLDDKPQKSPGSSKIDLLKLSLGERISQQKDERFVGYNASQQELLEILQEFKEKKFSLNEVEHLFEDWKLRQSNSQSFKEKEEHLSSLRTKYDQIQQQASEKGKKSLSFEKIVSLFTGSASKKSPPATFKQSKTCVTVPKKLLDISYDEFKNRPTSTMSNLSVASSCSSSSFSSDGDRLSTISSASTCDSGAQSDSGEDTVHTRIENLGSIRRASLNPTEHELQKRVSVTLKERISKFEYNELPPPVPVFLGLAGQDSRGAPISQRPLLLKPQSSSKLGESSQQPASLMKKINIEDRKPMPPPRPDLNPAQVISETESGELSPDYVIPDPVISDFSLPFPMGSPNSNGNSTIRSYRKSNHSIPQSSATQPPSSKQRNRTTQAYGNGRDGSQDVDFDLPDYVNVIYANIPGDILAHPTRHNDYYNVTYSKTISDDQPTNWKVGGGGGKMDNQPTKSPRTGRKLPVCPRIEFRMHKEQVGGMPNEFPPPLPPASNPPSLPPRLTMKGRPLPEIPR